MKKPFRAQHEATVELEHAARWYEERRSGLGQRFLASVEATLEQIRRFPGAGAPIPRVPPDLAVRRAPIKGFPYHLIYLETVEVIHILAPLRTTGDDPPTGSLEPTVAPSPAPNGRRVSGERRGEADERVRCTDEMDSSFHVNGIMVPTWSVVICSFR